MLEIINRIFCRHTKLLFVRNLYGDQINYSGGFRSTWECAECGKPFRRRALFPLADEAFGKEKFLVPRVAIVFSEKQINTRRMATAFYTASSIAAAFSANPQWLVFSAVAFVLAGNSYVILRQMRNLKILED
jgi:hypothetical protein